MKEEKGVCWGEGQTEVPLGPINKISGGHEIL